MLNKKIATVLMVFLSLIMFGCSSERVVVDGPPENKSDNAVIVTPNANKKVSLGVYIDGTASMSGYVNYPTSTVYVNAIKKIESTVATKWSDHNIQFFKFGSKNNEIDPLERSEFLRMDQTSFYCLDDTSLQKVVAGFDNNHDMSIIITDMFQTDRDVESFMLELKKKLLANPDNVFAMVGIKSQFSGTIYDFSKDLSRNVSYSSESDKEDTFRPFYLLIFGNKNTVGAFVGDYAAEFTDKSVIFTKSIGENISVKDEERDLNDATSVIKVDRTEGLVSNNDVLQYKLFVDERQYGATLQLTSENIIGSIPHNYDVVVNEVEKWVSNGNENARLQLLPGFILELLGQKEEKAIEGNCGEYEFKSVSAEKFVVGKVLDVKNIGNTLKMQIDLIFDAMAIEGEKGIYRVKYSVVPSKKSYLEAAGVFDDWNLSEKEVDENLIGRKTLNVSKITEMIGTLNYEINRPGFHNLYFYVDVRR